MQLITALISTKSSNEESLRLRDDDYAGDPRGERSHVLPWSLATLPTASGVDYYLTSIVDDRIEDVVTHVIEYVSA